MLALARNTVLTTVYACIVLFCIQSTANELPVMRGIGQDFEAESTLGKLRLSDLNVQVTLMTFGFTNCPDICPITLGYLANLYQQLSDNEKHNLKILFVSVDPTYDTVPHLQKYLAYYEPDFVGVSPTEIQLKKITKAFNIKYEKVKQIKIPVQYNRPTLLKSSEEMQFDVFNHSVSILVLDQKKRVRAVKYSGDNTDEFLADIRSLFKETNEAH